MGDLPNLANLDYVERVNRAIDHVTRNLGEPLKLEDVAKVACFSPYHFHRIFRAVVGETLHDFVKRVRLERAVHLMAHGKGRGKRAALTQVALACGFASSSDFSRSFRQHFGMAPRAFDVGALQRERREQLMRAVPDGHRLAQLPDGANPDGFVPRIRDLPARRVAYVRVFRPYGGKGVLQAVERLRAWATAHGAEGGQWLGYQWDDPEIVPLEQCRYDVGLEIPARLAVEGRDVNEARFAPMKVAEIEIRGPIDLEMRAIDFLYKTWLPRSGYAPDHQPMFEAWMGAPFAHGTTHFELRLHLAVTGAV